VEILSQEVDELKEVLKKAGSIDAKKEFTNVGHFDQERYGGRWHGRASLQS
jgi:hypothetical protein